MSAKKCIVLDLDNTLWGGVIGEDGMEGIKLGLSEPGASFVAFQQALLDLHHRGIVLAVNSYNNEADAMEVIRKHPNMVLKEDHFAARRINWGDKTANIRELAQELNIGLDSMVFLDDMPMNRESMRALVPEVETPELPADPADYVKFLLSLGYFDGGPVTDEDKMRGNLYVTERLRKEAEKAFTDKTDFLKSLRLEVSTHRDDASSIERLAQLTEKTNQFNTNKRPLTIDEMRGIIESPDMSVFHGSAIDRFGDSGIITLAIVDKGPDAWTIRSFVLSCRVFGRGIEHALLHVIARAAENEGVRSLRIELTPTEKNAPARDFVDNAFHDRHLSTDGALLPEWITLHHHDVQ